MRVMYAQDTEADAKTRNLGTIESFLLMTEWHTRALHFPPDDDGWDCELPDTGDGDESPIHGTICFTQVSVLCCPANLSITGQKRSTEEVEGAARRSDRMSW